MPESNAKMWTAMAKMPTFTTTYADPSTLPYSLLPVAPASHFLPVLATSYPDFIACQEKSCGNWATTGCGLRASTHSGSVGFGLQALVAGFPTAWRDWVSTHRMALSQGGHERNRSRFPFHRCHSFPPRLSVAVPGQGQHGKCDVHPFVILAADDRTDHARTRLARPCSTFGIAPP